MRYFINENRAPLLYVSSGNTVNDRNFILEKRSLDTFIIVIGIKGTVYIRQDDRRFTLKENQYLILFAGHEHEGFRKSEGPVSYYWCHFKSGEDACRLIGKPELSALFTSKPEPCYSQYYILPEYGDLSQNVRAILIFRQLLDIAREHSYTEKLPNYALSLLALEISQEYIQRNFSSFTNKEINPRLEKIIEWIRINYNLKPLSLKKIARQFNYNFNYLATAFSKYMGLPLMRYITVVKIDRAKNLLLNSRDGIKEIAYKVGYDDEKVFMKRFKQFEGTSPTKFRNAFSRAKLIH